MPRRPDDDRRVAPVARRGALAPRSLILAGGFVLALAATLAVFLTDNPQYLRIAVVAVAWAFVLAAFAAGRRGGDRAAAAAREAELHHAYERELDREVAARREYELELENELRRGTEDSIRGELDALRGEIAALSGLREEVARVSALRGDIAALTDLRDQVARVAALREDLLSLNSLRQELGQLAELRADMGRLRAELTEQLSSEMLVERIVMRTQASRLPAEPSRAETGSGRVLEGAGWADDVPPRELTGGWPAIRLDEPRETQQFDPVRVDRSGSRPPVPAAEPVSSWQSPSWETPAPPWETPRTGLFPAAPLPPPVAERSYVDPPTPPTATFPASPPPVAPVPPGFGSPLSSPFSAPLPAPPAADRWSSSLEPDLAPRRSRHSRHADDEPVAPPATAAFPMAPPAPSEPAQSPLDWLAARSRLDPATDATPATSASPAARPSPISRPEVPPRRRRSDELAAVPVPDEFAPTTQRPAVPVRPSPTPRDTPPATEATPRPEFDRSAFRFAVRDDAPAAPAQPNPDLARILAENGGGPATGARRRRRYRDDGEADDVLARVLGRD